LGRQISENGQLILFLSKAYTMEYYSSPSHAPLSSFIKWLYGLARREYRYSRANGYLVHLLLIPFLEVRRIFFFWRGLRMGRAEYSRM